jgi:hypothetical protein
VRVLPTSQIIAVAGIREPADGDEAEIDLATMELIATPRTELRFAGAMGANSFALAVAALYGNVTPTVVVPSTMDDEPAETRDAVARWKPRVVELRLRQEDPDREHALAERVLDGAERLVAFWDGLPGRTAGIIEGARRKGIAVEIEPLVGRQRDQRPHEARP